MPSSTLENDSTALKTIHDPYYGNDIENELSALKSVEPIVIVANPYYK